VSVFVGVLGVVLVVVLFGCRVVWLLVGAGSPLNPDRALTSSKQMEISKPAPIHTNPLGRGGGGGGGGWGGGGGGGHLSPPKPPTNGGHAALKYSPPGVLLLTSSFLGTFSRRSRPPAD